MQWLHPSSLWRAALHASDCAGHLRRLQGRPRLDVVFITNVRDEAERRRFFADPTRRDQHASGPRVRIGGVQAQVRGFNLTAAELGTRSGRKLARELFLDCVRWAQDQGARVVLLAASTKRLFGRAGAELKALFPELIFTIGDNGTACLLGQDVERVLQASGLQRPRVLVLGAYGILGQAVAERLQAQGHEVLGWGPSSALLQEWAARSGIPAQPEFERIGAVDVVVACTHSPDARLDAARVRQLQRLPGQPLLVVDVSEPANLDARTVQACAGRVWRQDAGNAHAVALRYGLGPLSWRQLQLCSGTVFGCFAEALALASLLRRQPERVQGRDWFEVSAYNQFLVARAFAELGLDLPTPHSFGRPVRIPRLQPARAEPDWPEARLQSS